MLVELNNYSVPQQINECFTRLGDCGVTPVITHPERNPILRESPQRVLEWAEQGCVIQVTGGALTGFWGERVRRAARWLLEHDAVHVLRRRGRRCAGGSQPERDYPVTTAAVLSTAGPRQLQEGF